MAPVGISETVGGASQRQLDICRLGRSLSLKQSEFWPLEANDDGLVLEEFKAGFVQLEEAMTVIHHCMTKQFPECLFTEGHSSS